MLYDAAMSQVQASGNPPTDGIGAVEFTSRVVHGMAEEVHSRLRAASIIGHPGEAGRARENIVRDFLRNLVPRGFSIDTGFVIDTQGGMSLQQDVVIYRDAYHPLFTVGGVKHFTIESASAVVEVKSRITSAAALRSALDNGASVKRLDRTGRGNNYTVVGSVRGEDVNPDHHIHQVYSAVLTVDCLSIESTRSELGTWLARHPRREWPNQVVATNKFSTAYIPSEPRVDQMNAQTLTFGAFDSNQEFGHAKNTYPILDFAQQLMSFLRVCPIIDYQPSAYLPGSYTPSNYLPLSDRTS